jgi:hypothetical protein
MGHKSLSQFIQSQSGIKGQQPEVFGPQYFSYGQDVIDQMNATDVQVDVENALNKYSTKQSQMSKNTRTTGSQ